MLTAERLRYLTVSIGCVVLHNIIVIVAAAAGLHYAWSTVLSVITIIVVGYLAHVYYTFRQAPSARSFLLYAAAASLNLPLALACMYLCVDILGLPVVLASPVTTAVAFIWNFLMARFIITGRKFIPDWRE